MVKSYKIYHESFLGKKSKTMEAHTDYGAALDYAEWYNEKNDHALNSDGEEIIIENPEGHKSRWKIVAEVETKYNYEADNISDD